MLHHGTLLYAFDVAKISQYLNAPERSPAYRAGRDHPAFVVNLPADAPTLKRLVASEFEAEREQISATILAQIPRLIDEKYGREDWVRRR